MVTHKTVIQRRIQFCYGHRVYGHESKCKNLHGHNGVLFVHAYAKELDSIGRVIDFSVLKQKIGNWVEENWDHGFIYYQKDEETKKALSYMKEQKQFELPYNPTAENMCKFLLLEICPELLKDTYVKVIKVELWETENCLACVELTE